MQQQIQTALSPQQCLAEATAFFNRRRAKVSDRTEQGLRFALEGTGAEDGGRVTVAPSAGGGSTVTVEADGLGVLAIAEGFVRELRKQARGAGRQDRASSVAGSSSGFADLRQRLGMPEPPPERPAPPPAGRRPAPPPGAPGQPAAVSPSGPPAAAGPVAPAAGEVPAPPATPALGPEAAATPNPPGAGAAPPPRPRDADPADAAVAVAAASEAVHDRGAAPTPQEPAARSPGPALPRSRSLGPVRPARGDLARRGASPAGSWPRPPATPPRRPPSAPVTRPSPPSPPAPSRSAASPALIRSR